MSTHLVGRSVGARARRATVALVAALLCCSAAVAQTRSVGFSATGSRTDERSGVHVVPVSLSGPASGTVTVGVSARGTATAGVDYRLLTPSLVFTPGVTALDVRIELLPDALIEGVETIGLTLGTPTGGTLGAQSAHTVSVLDAAAPAGPKPVPPALTVSTGQISFPTVMVGDESAPQVIVVSNPHNAPLGFSGLAPSSGATGSFTVGLQGGTFPVTLAPGQAALVELRFRPAVPGAQAATFTVQQSFGGFPPATVNLSGIALGPAGSEVRMNLGPDAFVDGALQYWSSEFGVLVSDGLLVQTGDVLGTSDDPLYLTSRVGGYMVLRLPLPNGTYDVSFRSWEPEHNAVGARVFDVVLENQVRFDDVDVFALAGQRRAWQSPVQRVTVLDGALDVRFEASARQALVSALEVVSATDVVAVPTQLDFDTVDLGSYRELDLRIENRSSVATRLTGLQIFAGATGPASEFSVEVAGQLYAGGPNTSTYSLDVPLGPGANVTFPVLFTPLEHRDNEALVRFQVATGAELDIELLGTGGAEAGWGFLHPVIELTPTLVVDYDGDGSELVELDATQSHTHEPGQFLTAFEWRRYTQPIATQPITLAAMPLGLSVIELTIEDSNSPPNSATARAPLFVYPASNVPGILAQYYDGSVVGEVTLLDNVPARPDFVERQIALRTALAGATIGGSPFAADVMVRWTANFALAAPTTVTFVVAGGTGRRIFVNGQPAVPNLSLPAGLHSLDVRFAVNSLVDLPISVVATSAGAPIQGFESRLTHAEGQLPPVIHTLPAVGLDLGGNDIVLTGFGFFPRGQVTVNWGGTAISANQFTSYTPERLEFVSPPGTGVIQVSVTTPNGTSNSRSFQYSPSGPVPVRWNVLNDRAVSVTSPTRGTFGPDGRLWVTLLDGSLRAVRYDDNWNPISVQAYPGVSGLTNKDVLGITFNPFEPHDPLDPTSPHVYVAHGQHFLGLNTPPNSPSPFTGQVSRLVGPNYDVAEPIVAGLPTSNHDHSVNGIEFDDNGDLLITVGANTNAGVASVPMGGLPESPFSGAVLKALTSKRFFDGNVVLLDRSTQQVITDQRLGEQAVVAPTVDVEVFAAGMRNPFDLVLHSNGYIYATDNGPNDPYGPGSTGLNTQFGAPDPDHPDELLLLERGNYYGHPNRARAVDDPRQAVYRDELVPSIPHVFTQRIAHLPSSTNGIEEYRATTFGGQLRGDLFVMELGVGIKRHRLQPDGRRTLQPNGTPFTNVINAGLDIAMVPGGAIATVDYYSGQVRIQAPDDVAAVGLSPYDVFPARGPNVAGVPFEIGGRGFGTLGATSVSFQGVPATVTAVTPQRIRGIVPAQAPGFVGTVDITVMSAGQQATLTAAYRYLPPQSGLARGRWRSLPLLPFAVGEVAVGEVAGLLYVFGEGDPRTMRFDALNGTWDTAAAPRPYPGGHHACETHAGRIYLFGGLGGGSEGRVQIFDVATGMWSLGAPMPYAGGSVASAKIGTRVYIAGGIVGSGTVGNVVSYDLVANTWTSHGAMPVPVNHAASGTDGVRFFVFGGRQGGNVPQPGFTTVQAFDPVAGTWVTSQSGALRAMPLPRGGTGKAAWYRGAFYVLGGEDTTNVFRDVQVYNPTTNSWVQEALLPTARHGVFPVVFEDRLFVFGGGTNAGASASAAAEVFQRP